jgi:hypothetical protein
MTSCAKITGGTMANCAKITGGTMTTCITIPGLGVSEGNSLAKITGGNLKPEVSCILP